MVCTARVKESRQKLLTMPQVCVERGYLLTQSYKETENEPTIIRRAKSLEKILTQIPISIGEDEVIVGRLTSKVRGGALVPEVRADWYLEEMDTISTRQDNRFAPLTEEEKAKIKEFIPYWKGKSVFDKWCAILPENIRNLYSKVALPNSSPMGNSYLTHNALDFERILRIGLNGIKQETDRELKKLNVTDAKYPENFLFLKAVSISLEAVNKYTQRYAELAARLAEKEADSQRKMELERIAAACNWIPANPPRSFFEALQSVWFVFVITMLEGWSGGLTFGRADQYLYPYYDRDIREGKITPTEVHELLAQFYLNTQRWVNVTRGAHYMQGGGFVMLLSITLGGITKDGKDAVNALSYLLLDVDRDLKLSSPDFVIRVNKNNPESFLIRACENLKLLKGKYKFVSDDTIIQQQLSDGKPIEFARDYIIAGCWAATIPGRCFDNPGAHVNLPLMLELALNNGTLRLTGEQIGPPTGDSRQFKSYEEVWNAYKIQLESQIPNLIFLRNVDMKVFAEYAPCPFTSALFQGCISSGLDITAGGTAPYISQSLTAAGAPNVGDSLAAIKKAVFEDKKITMDRLIQALNRNFEGEEEVLSILKEAPKFGNDNDYVDSIVNEVIVHFSDEVAKYKGIAGAKSIAAAAIVAANVPMGQVIGALPDGRRSGEPLSEGGLSPYQGRNVSGPTATVRSVAKLNHIKLTNGSVLNMKFNPEVLNSDLKLRKFASLIRTYCETGGYLIQFNIVDTNTLREAQKHPEKYRDLLIRVATYSAYFVELGSKLQDDIIARMEFEEI